MAQAAPSRSQVARQKWSLGYGSGSHTDDMNPANQSQSNPLDCGTGSRPCAYCVKAVQKQSVGVLTRTPASRR